MEEPPRRTSKRRAAALAREEESKKRIVEVETAAAVAVNTNESDVRNVDDKKNTKMNETVNINNNNDNSNDNNMNDSGSDTNDDEDPFVKLTPLPDALPFVNPLTKKEIEELESVFEFQVTNDSWKHDWTGNLALCEKDVMNPSVRSGSNTRNSFRQPLLSWAANSPDCVRLLRNLLRFVCNMEKVPITAKKILGLAVVGAAGTSTDTTTGKAVQPEVDEVIALVHRASYDPQVLREDGWTVEKSNSPQGASGGPYLIGDKLRVDHSDAVVIAYVHDPDIGDLWKALWIHDRISFDMEAEELLEAKRKYERRYERITANADGNGNVKSNNSSKARRNTRYAISNDFSVNGIEYGIVLCASFSKGARQGVYWPARVMHASEAGEAAQARRSSSKQKLDMVFLAPYWCADDLLSGRSRRAESLFDNAGSLFDSNPLLQVETIDASDEMIKEYPYANNNELDMEQLRMSFRFTGLPKAAFPRYIDAHRLAMSLLMYAKQTLKSKHSEVDKATAGLFETHPMALQVPNFPSVVLHLPFEYILSQLPRSLDTGYLNGNDNGKEPVIKLEDIVGAMNPPACWGDKKAYDGPVTVSNANVNKENASEWLRHSTMKDDSKDMRPHEIQAFMTDYPYLNDSFNRFRTSPPLIGVLSSLTRLLAQVAEEEESKDSNMTGETRRSKLQCLVTSWSTVKRFGEESLATLLLDNAAPILAEWRRCCEKIYRFIVAMYSDGTEIGVGVSVVITDPRCNEHRTSNGCFERPVRLPAALKGIKLAGAGTEPQLRLLTSVPDDYMILAETKILKKAHGAPYLKRMKSRCAAGKTDKEIIALTEDSDGDGGEDTQGSRGTWNAAVVGVGAALAAADMVVRGECVNAFCATRPPGHHAGRSLHPMKAISNGFCILNPVACAAIYAVSPISDGGLGLSRVCVLDFDVHHGNGTQDILCSTFDPRFLYVSLHAGGAKINGHPMEDDPNHELHDLNATLAGIYPGRCGDTSPHKGVLNIPLGEKVTSHAVGTALVSLVSPRVESFAPDLIILSAGFDAHKSDPMGLGDLRAEDFGHITQVACQLAAKLCSGRVLSVLEGGYSVPCCRPQEDLFLPTPGMKKSAAPRPRDRKPSNATSGSTDGAPAVRKHSGGKTPIPIIEINLQTGKAIRKHESMLQAAQLAKCSRHVIYNVLNGHKPGWNGISWRYWKAGDPVEFESADEATEEDIKAADEATNDDVKAVREAANDDVKAVGEAANDDAKAVDEAANEDVKAVNKATDDEDNVKTADKASEDDIKAADVSTANDIKMADGITGMLPPEVAPWAKSEANDTVGLDASLTTSNAEVLAVHNKSETSTQKTGKELPVTSEKNGDKHSEDGGSRNTELSPQIKTESPQDSKEDLSKVNEQPVSLKEDIRRRPQPSKLLDLGTDLPNDMDDQVPYALQVRLEKCHAEGFVECVCEHVKSLSHGNKFR